MTFGARPKYGNKKVVTAEGEFASKVEYHRWLFLQEAAKNGEIFNLRRQVEYQLLPTQYRTELKKLKYGRVKAVQRVAERKVCYIADYVYEKADGQLVVEDTKGFHDDKYPLKRKMMLFFHGIPIREVKRATEPI
jgi:hypothetical protein